MKHHPFETWIIMDPDLTIEERRELHSHLNDCARCQTLHRATHQVAHLFKTSAVPVPAPGFSDRWKTRMERIEARRKILIFSTSVLLIAASLILLFALIGVQFSIYLSSVPQMLASFAFQFSRWLIFLTHLWDILDPLVGVGLKMISPLWVVTFGFSLSGILAAWIVSTTRSQAIHKELLP